MECDEGVLPGTRDALLKCRAGNSYILDLKSTILVRTGAVMGSYERVQATFFGNYDALEWSTRISFQ